MVSGDILVVAISGGMLNILHCTGQPTLYLSPVNKNCTSPIVLRMENLALPTQSMVHRPLALTSLESMIKM